MEVYTRYIQFLHLVGLGFASIFVLSLWDHRLHDYFNTVFFLEISVTIFLTILFTFMYRHLSSQINQDTTQKWLDYCFLGFIGLAIYGGGIHLGANQIREVVNIPIVYFYDEILSHWLAVIGFLGISYLFAFIHLKTPIQSLTASKIEKWHLYLSGAIHGLVAGISLLQANSAQLALIAAPVTIALAWKLKKKDHRLYPLTTYSLVAFTFLKLFILAWYFHYDSFASPSDVGFGRFE